MLNKYILSGTKVNGLISELKKLKFFDDNYNEIIGRYINLLVDSTLLQIKDVKIQYCITIDLNFMTIHFCDKFPFMATFNLDEPFNENNVLEHLNEEDLVMNNARYLCDINELRHQKVLFVGPETNKKISEYLSLIVDDILVFGVHFETEFSLNVKNNMFTLEMTKSYPFVGQFIELKFDLNDPVDIKNISSQLDELRKHHNYLDHVNYYVSLDIGKQFLNRIDIIEKALDYNGRLKDVYFKRSLYKVKEKFSFFDFEVKNRSFLELTLHSSETDMTIEIESNYIFIGFSDCDRFSWTFTDDHASDVSIIRKMFIIYLEKKLNKKISDLKREIQLIEMQTI